MSETYSAIGATTFEPEYTVRDQKRMEHARRYFEWQFAMAAEHLGPRVLEVGCGLGNFTRHLLGRDCIVGIDSEVRCIQNHRERFAGRPEVVSLRMDVLSPDFLTLRRYEPASIACLNVLEHVRNDRLALEHMHAVLPSGGAAVLIVPAFEALRGPIDERVGHYRRYSKRSLVQAAGDAGFRPRVLRYINSVGFLGWWFNARVLGRTEQSTAQIRIFDSIVVPVLSRVERVIEPPAGQSIFAVLVKP